MGTVSSNASRQSQKFLVKYQFFLNYHKRQRKWLNSRRKTIKLLIQKIKIENFREPLLEKTNSTKRTKWCQKSRKKLWVPKLNAHLTLGTFYMLKVGEKC